MFALKKLYCLFFLCIPATSICQVKTYEVNFICTINTLVPLKATDSMLIIKDGDSSKIPCFFSKKINVNTKLMAVKVIANQNKCTIKIVQKSAGWGEASRNKMYDSAVYGSNIWVAYNNGTSKNIATQKVAHIYTNQSKYILGYTCYKVFTTNSNGVADTESWVCYKLPTTIMPYDGMLPLKAAILESTNTFTGITYRAKSVLKL